MRKDKFMLPTAEFAAILATGGHYCQAIRTNYTELSWEKLKNENEK